MTLRSFAVRTPFIAFAAVLALAGCGKPAAAAPGTPPPAEIEVATVATEAVPFLRTYVGRTTTRRSVELRVRVTGTLAERPFSEGGMVKQGDVLFRLDPREFTIAVVAAEARLAQTAANLQLARQDLARITPLAQSGAAAAKDLDTATSTVAQADADAKAADAALQNAKLQLTYATVTAPFDGRVGFAARDVGAIIGPSDGALAVLDGIDPLLVEFTISERELAEIRQMTDTGQLTGGDPARLVARAVLVDGSTYPEPGRIDYTDVRVRPDTGMSTMRAEFPNPKGRLLPGQFVRVRIEGLSRPAAITVPQPAVLQSPLGPQVYVVGDDDTVALRPVQAGSWTADGRWIIEGGLKAGERVVVASVLKVRPGQHIRPVTAALAAADPAAAAPAPATAGAHQ